MLIFRLFGQEDKTFFTFWYKSKQEASIEVTIVQKKFSGKRHRHLFSDILLIILLNIIGLC